MAVDSTAGMSANDAHGSSDVEKGAHARAANEIDTTMDDISDNDVSDDEASDDERSNDIAYISSVSDDNLSDDDEDASDYQKSDNEVSPSQSMPTKQQWSALVPSVNPSCTDSPFRRSESTKRRSRRGNREWRSRRQLATYRQMSKQIAEELGIETR